MPLPPILQNLPLPIIGAPMFIIANPKLVIEQCTAGIVGSMPALNARPASQLDEWLAEITETLAAWDRAHPERKAAPFAINQIVHKSNDRLEHDMEVCAKYKVPIVITSLGARPDVNEAVHGWGGVVLHDVINNRFARKAVEKGADGLIAVAAGAGGHAGVKSPFVLVAELREWFDGPLALSAMLESAEIELGAGRPESALKLLKRIDERVAAGPVFCVQRLAAKKAKCKPAEHVIHHCIKPIALEPVLGFVPDLADDIGFGIAFLHGFAECAPECDVVDFFWYVEAPAVDAKIDPVAGDIQQVAAYTLILDVELGQGRYIPPGIVVGRPLGVVIVGAQRPVAHREPIEVGRVAAALEDVVEGPKAARGVVKHTVQNDIHAARVRRVQEFAQRLVAAEQRIYLHVIECVVAVV